MRDFLRDVSCVPDNSCVGLLERLKCPAGYDINGNIEILANYLFWAAYTVTALLVYFHVTMFV